VINYHFLKEEFLLVGDERVPILVNRHTGKVVEAFVRGKWVSAEVYSVWQECYEAQQQRNAFVRPEYTS